MPSSTTDSRTQALTTADNVAASLLSKLSDEAQTFSEGLSLLVQAVKLRECDRRSTMTHIRTDDSPTQQDPT